MAYWRILRWVPFWAVAAFAYFFLLTPFLIIAISSLEGSQSFYFNFPPRQINLAWYWQIPVKYFEAWAMTLIVAAGTAVCSAAIGTCAALGIVRSDLRGKEWFQTFFRLPLQIPFVVTGVAFLIGYYQVADVIGYNFAGTFPGLILAFVFVTTPYTVGTVSSVLVRLNPSIEEAAESLGATPWSTFWRITFPLIRPGIFAGVMYSFIISFGDVPIVVFLAGPDVTTLPAEIFHSLTYDFDPAILSLSTLVVLFSLFLIIVTQRVVGLDLVLPSRGGGS